MELLAPRFETISEESLTRYAKIVLALQLQSVLNENENPPIVRQRSKHSTLKETAKLFEYMVDLFDQAMKTDDMCAFGAGTHHAVDLHATNLTTALVYYGLTGNSIAVLSPPGYHAKCEQTLSFLKTNHMKDCADSIMLFELDYFTPIRDIEMKKMLHQLLSVCVDIFISYPRLDMTQMENEPNTYILDVLDEVAASIIEFPERLKKGVRYGETEPTFFGMRKCIFPLHATIWNVRSDMRKQFVSIHSDWSLTVDTATNGTGTWKWNAKGDTSKYTIMCATKVPVDTPQKLWFYPVSIIPSPQ